MTFGSLPPIILMLIYFSDGINSDVGSTMEFTEPTVTSTSSSGIISSTSGSSTTITTSSILSSSSHSSFNPDYGITNVTTQIGTNAYLPCKVKKIFNKSVSWVRVRDDHILTVDRVTFIADERFHAYYASSPGYQPGPWTLQIKYVQARDAGIYECQVSSEPKISARVYLHVVVPKTELIGDTNRYVKEGSKVSLHCVVTGAIDPPLYIIWYHSGQQVFADNRRGWRTEIIRNTPESDSSGHSTIGSLTIPAVKKKDSGNYTCTPSNSESIDIVLHVINGEYSASAITSASTSHHFNQLLGVFCMMLLLSFQT